MNTTDNVLSGSPAEKTTTTPEASPSDFCCGHCANMNSEDVFGCGFCAAKKRPVYCGDDACSDDFIEDDKTEWKPKDYNGL